jgi:hypothetical protein
LEICDLIFNAFLETKLITKGSTQQQSRKKQGKLKSSK